MITIVAAFLFVLLSVLVMTPMTEQLAWRIGAVDVPRDSRRMHQRTIARSGGIAIFLSFLLGVLLFCERNTFLLRCLLGASMVFLMGLLDDVRTLKPSTKLLVQIVAGVVVCGISLRPVTLFSVFWLVTLCNAHNFIDGLDGLFAGCSAVECVALSVMLLLVGQGSFALPVAMLAAACATFRFYNRYPARVFAGDCGSETVGFLLGAFSLLLFYEMRWSAGWLSPLFLFAYPLTDLVSSVLRRLLNGRSPFSADRAHLHHRLMACGMGQKSCVLIFITITSMLALLGILLCTDSYVLASAVICLLAAAALTEIQRFLDLID